MLGSWGSSPQTPRAGVSVVLQTARQWRGPTEKHARAHLPVDDRVQAHGRVAVCALVVVAADIVVAPYTSAEPFPHINPSPTAPAPNQPTNQPTNQQPTLTAKVLAEEELAAAGSVATLCSLQILVNLG